MCASERGGSPRYRAKPAPGTARPAGRLRPAQAHSLLAALLAAAEPMEGIGVEGRSISFRKARTSRAVATVAKDSASAGLLLAQPLYHGACQFRWSLWWWSMWIATSAAIP